MPQCMLAAGLKLLFKRFKVLKNRVSVEREKMCFDASFLTSALVGEKYGFKKTQNAN